MDPTLQVILNNILQSETINAEEKNNITKALNDVDQELTEKNRDLQIEAALERVRARTMAMQKSSELAETVSLLFKQLLGLGIRTEQIRTCGIVTFKDDEPIGEQWITETNGEIIPQSFMVPYDEAPAYKAIYKGWKQGEQFMVIHLEGEKLKEHLGNLAKGTNVPTRDVVLPQQATEIFNHVLFFSKGCLFIITKEALPRYHDVFKRFGGVFQQSYTRFLDLKKAEAQAREAKIEAALEKVRSRSLAMHQSGELQQVVTVVFKQLQELGISVDGVSICTFIEKSKDIVFWTAVNEQLYTAPIYFPYFEHPVPADFWKAKEDGLDFYAKAYTVEEKNTLWTYNFEHTDFKNLPGERKQMILDSPGYTFAVAREKNSAIAVNNFAGKLFSEQDVELIKRFAKAFEQAYVRFLDLQKAEEQAREAKIEAALERVRSRTMAMQKSEELREAIQLIFEQFVHLSFNIDSASFNPDHRADNNSRLWIASSYLRYPSLIYTPYLDHPIFNIPIAARDAGSDHCVTNLTFSEKNEFFDHFFKNSSPIPDAPADVLDRIYNSPGFYSYGVLMKTDSLTVTNYLGIAYTEAEEAVVMRFGKVFEQTYTRFRDLEQAEEQAREAQIETALERVRSRTMGMQKSEELRDIIQVIYEQLVWLNFNVSNAIFLTDYRADNDMTVWLASSVQSYPAKIFVPYFDHPIFNIALAARDGGADHYVTKLTFSEKNQWWDHFLKNASPPPDFPRPLLDRFYNAPGYDSYGVLMKTVTLAIANYAGYAYTEAEEAVVMRFGNVFEQTYTRFLDLQRAEEQAREAQIEAALEKVRSRSLAMHKSNELRDVVKVVFEKLQELSFGIDGAAFIVTPGELPREVNIWIGDNHAEYPSCFKTPFYNAPVITDIFDAIDSGLDFFSKTYAVNEKNPWFEYAFEHTDYKYLPEELRSWILAQENLTQCFALAKNSAVGIHFHNRRPLSENETDILRRFSKVFEQSYIRFLDLQKAEAQVREAKIEAALEKVRARALAMHQSQDINTAVLAVFEELEKLNLDILRCGIGIIDNENKVGDIWTTVKLDGKSSVQVSGKEPMNIHPLMQGTYDAWLNQTDFLYELKGDDLAAYYRAVAGTNFTLPESHSLTDENYGAKQYYYTPTFKTGNLYAFKDSPFPDDAKLIMKRFASVLNLTFSRFLDLQKAEAQAREAVKQASLDRVRGEIASMRTTKDLERIIPLVWDELTILGIPFIRCGVFIVDEERELIHTHLSTPDGKALAAFDLPFEAEGIGRDVLPAWRKKRMAAVHWSAKEFAAYTKNLVSQGAVKSRGKYVTQRPNTTLDLHFFPFLQGMLYVGNTEPLKDSEKDLVLSLAEAFSTAYARYEDFNKLEAAKQQVDKTLNELKATQNQLIQSEKMASLGVLTAGIAHEIQNPLNFVNNFSEVNKELLEELKAESKKPKGERDEALEIDLINDVIENSKKINMHGKRADGIVKGMLQHSQSGSGKKEPTNINALADEYMRLSYHGLRAKDKNFNAEMVTHFDADLPKISVIGQDIGRVMLNLFNNAFYAVNQKQKTAGADHKPEVSVTTSHENGKVMIIVKDNGIGIPEGIKEKIMQPFFTTKPTGEGTGLGLSLTYDMVVKGHGGSIQVNSAEGAGSEFIIQLPNS